MSMSDTVDCLLIGHNETDFAEYLAGVEKMGRHSGAFRDLNLAFVNHGGNPHNASSLYNIVSEEPDGGNEMRKILGCGSSLSSAVAYLGTYLHRRGLSFEYINAFQEEKKRLEELLTNRSFLTVAITTTYYISVFPIVEIVKFVRRFNSSVKIIVGGPFIAAKSRVADTMTLEYLLDTIGADIYVNSSQGEETLVKLIRALKQREPYHGIPNLLYRQDDGFAVNAILRENNSLSENMVDWQLFAGNDWEYASVRTTISCPFACSFCGFPEHAGKYQAASIEAIKSELDSIAKHLPVKRVHFVDDTINVPNRRFKVLLKEIIDSGRRFRWHSQYRCQFADPETIGLMKDSGCEGVFLGIESGNDSILEHMNKLAKVDEYKRGIALLKEAGITTYASFIVGFPGETEATVRDTISFIEATDVDFYRTQVWYCEQITPIWRERRRFDLRGSNFEWSHRSMNSSLAGDLVEEIFMGHRRPVWVPQYGFDFGNIFHLLNHGLDMDDVKNYLRAFNQGVKEKLINPTLPGLSGETLGNLRRSVCGMSRFIPPDLHVMEESDLQADFSLD